LDRAPAQASVPVVNDEEGGDGGDGDEGGGNVNNDTESLLGSGRDRTLPVRT